MTNTTTIALNKLLAWQGNVRKTDPDKAIDELAASIAAHGLLQSLVVRKGKRGKYAVVAGQRRLLALKSLAEAEMIDADRPIPCTVIAQGADATEISLAENVQREQMHPADEFDAFKALIDSGVPVADVAARFGVTEGAVKQRLKLATVSPALIAAYRKGEMTLQHVMAFAVTDDHAAQERVWNELSEWQKEDPDNVRQLLTAHELTAADRRVKFVTLEAYQQAGGTIRRDLFSDGEDGVFIEDVMLLETLAIAGAVVTLGSDGKEEIRYGYVKPEDAPAKSANPRRKAGGKPPLPASLVESLTAHRSAALAAELLQRPEIAFAATVHALALPVFYNNGAREFTTTKITAQAALLHRVEDSPAAGIIATAEESWGERLPCNPDGLFAWCLAQDAATLRGLLAFCVARTVNAVLLKTDHADSPRMRHASMMADALTLDMTAWFTPTAANYFGKVSKSTIIEALREVKGAVAPAWSSMKKTDLAILAERTIAGTGWLPELLRAPAAVTAPTVEAAA